MKTLPLVLLVLPAFAASPPMPADLAAAEPTDADKAALQAWEDQPKSDAAILPLGDATALAIRTRVLVDETMRGLAAAPESYFPEELLQWMAKK